MIKIDYSNYYQSQAEWADGLLRAAERAHPLGKDKERELTLAAGTALDRLTRWGRNETITVLD